MQEQKNILPSNWKMKIKKHAGHDDSAMTDASNTVGSSTQSCPSRISGGVRSTQSVLSLKTKETEDESEFGFPRLDAIDKEQNLETYLSVVQRSPDEHVTVDELKPLQTELEALLSLAVTRQRNIQAYLDLSSPDQDIVERPPLVSNQRKRKLSDNRASTSTKDLLKARDNPPSDKPNSPSSCDETDISGDPDLGFDDSSKVAQPKINDLVNKFWSSVEPYVADITEDNIKELEELIKFCDSDMVGVDIPKLGRHYSEIWAQQDLNSERQASSQCHGSNTDSDSAPLLQQAFNHCKERTPGPMVQRLVSALLEDSAGRDHLQSRRISDDIDTAAVLAKLPLFHTTACFERRVRRELQAIRLLDSNHTKDEIYEEIKKCQEELKEVAAQNKRYLTDLMAEAKFEMSRQEIKRKMKAIDVEVIEMQRKTTAAKLKKKQLPPKIRDQAWKILKEREALSNELLSLQRN